MSTISATLKMFDAMTRPLQNITQSMNLVISTMQRMQSVTNRNINVDRSLIVAKNKIAAAEAEIRQAIEEADRAQRRFNQSVRNSQTHVDSLASAAKRMALRFASAYLSVRGIQETLKAADTFVTTRARLELIVDGGQSVQQLQDMIYAASQRVRGDYIAMANTVSRLGLLAGDAFANTGEIVAFAETMQKAFKISGASIEEQTSAMYQLTQAMAAGRLQGDEFRSIMENAPMLADAIAKFTGKSKGELKEMAAEGQITADVIKGALFSAANDINERFASMPKTFGEVWQEIKNNVWRAFQPIFEGLNRWLNSDQGVAVIQGITNAIQFAARTAGTLLNILVRIGDAIYRNWGIIEPILITIGSALLPLIIKRIWAMVTALWATIPPLLIQAKTWLLTNLPIMLIAAAIGFLIYALYRWGDVVAEVISFVGGIFGALFGHLYNNFAYFANVVLSVAEFFANVWRDPIYAVKKLFYDLVINALQWLTNLARGIENIINAIPGLEVNITSGLSNLLNRLEMARANLKTEADVVQLMRFQQMDYREAFSIGQRMGRSFGQFAANGIQNVVKKVGGLFDMQNINKLADSMSFPLDLDSVGKIGKVGEVGRINDTVDISNEDLKIMRELAEMKSIQNFVTLQPNFLIQTGDIRETADIEEIIAAIKNRLEEELVSTAQGVYGV